VNLEDYNCRSLEFDLFFSSDEFDKDAFLKEVDPDGTQEEYSWVFNSKQVPNQQHAHIELEFSSSPEDPHHARLIYIRSKREVISDRKQYMENCARWLGGFFKVETVYMMIGAGFEFDKSYVPLIALPFPLVPIIDGSKVFVGSSVTGVSLEFPEASKLETAVIQRFDDEMVIKVTAFVGIRVKRFNAANELKKLSASVGKLIRKSGETK
jgi:hypothetical protein